MAGTRPDPRLFAGLLWERSRTGRRSRWDRRQLSTFQRRRLDDLLHHAWTHSPHHRAALIPGAALSDQPVLTKQTLMDRWDSVCTVPSLHLADVEAHLTWLDQCDGDPGRPWRGRWWMAATGGTTGQRATFVWDRAEWTRVLASYARVNDLAGVRVGLNRPLSTAIVSSTRPSHQSAVVGASLRSRLVPTLRLDARRPLDELAEELNRFNPRLLVAYASLLEALGQAQVDGRLHLHPEKVIAASEPLSGPARSMVSEAWGHDALVETYAATETGGLASTCTLGGLHLYEDFTIVEPVDADHRPVPVGEVADRLLVTVLSSRTLPLIRYELTDSVRLSTRECACGSPFALLEAIEGRSEDTLELPGRQGGVRVHPTVFEEALERLAPHGWQVEERPGRLLVRVVAPAAAETVVGTAVEAALRGVGVVDPVVEVVTTTRLERTPLGKVRLVRAMPPRPGDGA